MNFRVHMFVKSAVNNLAINIRWNEVPCGWLTLAAASLQEAIDQEFYMRWYFQFPPFLIKARHFYSKF